MSLAFQPVEARRARRDEVDYRCPVTLATAQTLIAHLVNISPLGCMIRCDADAAPDEPITLRLPTIGRIDGRIIWIKLDRIGIEFTRPVGAPDYAVLLKDLSPLGRCG